MRNKLFLLGFLAWLFHSCSTSTPKDGFLVELDVKGGEGQMIYLTELNSIEEVLLDSARIRKGEPVFFSQKRPYPSIFLIKNVGNKEFLCVIPHLNEKITIQTSYQNFVQDAEIISDATSLSPSLLEIQQLVRVNQKKYDSLSRVWNESKYVENAAFIRQKLDSIYLKAFEKQKSFQIQKIDSNLHNLLPIFAYYQVFGNNAVFDLDSEEDFQRTYRWANTLYQYQKGNPHVDKFYQRIHRIALLRQQAELEKISK